MCIIYQTDKKFNRKNKKVKKNEENLKTILTNIAESDIPNIVQNI